MDGSTFIGIIGAFLILIPFTLSEIGKIKPKSLVNGLSNILGATILIIYSVFQASWPFIILSIVWIGIWSRKTYEILISEQ